MDKMRIEYWCVQGFADEYYAPNYQNDFFTEKDAINDLKKQLEKQPEYTYYIQYFRPRDDQELYLNPDYMYDITGEPWN